MLDIKYILEIIKPKKNPYTLIRVGGKYDGGYLIPNDLKDIKACFSPGVSNRKDFEDDLAKRFKIKSYMCDYSSSINEFKTSLIKNLQFFDKKWLDTNSNRNSITLENWVSKYISNDNFDLILQMDIEGAEYRNLLNSSEFLLKRFRILIIEFHNFTNLLNNKNDKEIGVLLNKLNNTHTCVHAHPNNCSRAKIHNETGLNIPEVIELTFLRNDRFLNKNNLINPELPNYEDIRCNVIANKPLHLNTNWLKPHKRNLRTKLKILEDYIFWFLLGPIYKIYAKFPIKRKIINLFK